MSIYPPRQPYYPDKHSWQYGDKVKRAELVKFLKKLGLARAATVWSLYL